MVTTPLIINFNIKYCNYSGRSRLNLKKCVLSQCNNLINNDFHVINSLLIFLFSGVGVVVYLNRHNRESRLWQFPRKARSSERAGGGGVAPNRAYII
jgi:hypothetical protein